MSTQEAKNRIKELVEVINKAQSMFDVMDELSEKHKLEMFIKGIEPSYEQEECLFCGS